MSLVQRRGEFAQHAAKILRGVVVVVQVHLDVAETFTGSPGVFVEIADTIRGFQGLCEGKYDHLPEQAFYMVGTIEAAVEKGKNLAAAA